MYSNVSVLNKKQVIGFLTVITLHVGKITQDQHSSSGFQRRVSSGITWLPMPSTMARNLKEEGITLQSICHKILCYSLNSTNSTQQVLHYLKAISSLHITSTINMGWKSKQHGTTAIESALNAPESNLTSG